ncbi:MAG: hypothetical protein IPI67_39430 [Myxococcales bacterium]|nr:hypothetical protein [Myxococcales bacterium]
MALVEVKLSLEALLAQPPVVAANDTLSLKVVDVAARSAELFALPLLGNVVALDLFDQSIGPAGAALLAASPYVAQLSWLDLGYCQLGQTGLEALCASKNLPRLRYVNLASNGFPDPCDDPSVDQGAVIGWGRSALGAELEAKFGPLPWLHWQGDPRPTPAAVLWTVETLG